MIIAGISDFIVGDLTDWVIDVIDAIGYAGVAFLVALENVFPPIPSEIVLPAAGFAANQGDANVILMIVAATIGSVVGAWVLYGVSAAIGPIRVHNFTVKYGRWFGVSAHDLDRAEDWFDDHSNKAVMICRCVPLIRSLVSVPAGFRRMAPVPFTIYTTIGSAVWNTLLVGAGYLLGDNWEQVGEYIDVIQYVVIAIILLAVAYWVWTRLISSEHKARREAQEAAAIQEFAEDDAERLEELASEDQS